jgi:hypothetical protein
VNPGGDEFPVLEIVIVVGLGGSGSAGERPGTNKNRKEKETPKSILLFHLSPQFEIHAK